MAFTTALRRGPEYSGIPEVPSGSKFTPLSPPPDISIVPSMESSCLDNSLTDQKGEAAHTIPEECERLFCDQLSAIFLGERRLRRQESLGIGAPQPLQLNYVADGNSRIERWIEVLDYTGDAIYRGFITDQGEERTLFVFLTDSALGPGFKTGLIALFELGELSDFGCSRIVACTPRSENGTDLEVIRNLGWCGFSLTSLGPWISGDCFNSFISPRWIFLSAEV